jgi:hypothetical protein
MTSAHHMPKMCPYGRECYRLRRGQFRCPFAHSSADVQFCQDVLVADLEAGVRDSSLDATPVCGNIALSGPRAATSQLLHPVYGDIALSRPRAATAQCSEPSDEPSESTQSDPKMPWWFDWQEYHDRHRQIQWVDSGRTEGPKLKRAGYVLFEVVMAKND